LGGAIGESYVTIDEVMPYFIGAVFLIVLASMVRGFFKHGGLKGMLFGASIKKTIGEVSGSDRSMMKTALRVHVLDAGPDKAVGIELVAKSMASYQMMPISLSVSETRNLIAQLQAALNVR
jgi:hypothetical protein